MNHIPAISLLTLLPIVGGVFILGAGSQKMSRNVALLVSLLTLAFAIALTLDFDSSSGGLQYPERHNWIPSLGVHYFVGLDGISLLMVLLTVIVTPMALLASRQVHERVPLYFALILFLQSGLLGTFTALNFFHWFIFWELSLIPAFFLIRLWGGPQRAFAATQFFIYTMVGSVAMLLAFLAIFLATRNDGAPGVSDFTTLAELGRNGGIRAALSSNNFGWEFFGHAFTAYRVCLLVFGGVLLGFAVKVPLMPFHTWLPAAYSEAPSPVTMLLTGVMSKMGVYGFIRIVLPIFSEELHTLRTPLLALAVITIVFSACAAFAQRDLKRILAYSSINHLGYCLLAVFAVASSGAGILPASGEQAGSLPHYLLTERSAALNGALLQVFNHGLTAATLFWFVSLLEQRSGGLRGLNDFGGLRKVAPVFCGLMGIALFSSLGLPGLNGFVGEFLIFKGVFPLAPWAASLSVIGILVTAIFILTILQRVFNGPLNEKWSKLPDLTLRERAMLAVPIALMFMLGVCPQLALGIFNASVVRMVGQLKF